MKRPRKVLLVENDKFARYMMREIILALGVDVEIAADGQQSVDILTAAPHDFGLVLMDLHMPQISGIEATRQIRQSRLDLPGNLPIIAMTADAAYQNDAIIQELGMTSFASKPVTPGQLLNLIDKFCDAA